MSNHIAFIGVGNMGNPMANQLIKAGKDVKVFDVSQDVIINEHDCGTLRGIDVTPLKKNDEIIEPLGDRIEGRVALQDVYHPLNDDLLVGAGVITPEIAQSIDASELDLVQVRSPLTCESLRGICVKCYGRDLARGFLVNLGETVGMIAAQSIGEPGTQLTMRTFHIGGTAQINDQSVVEVNCEGIFKILNISKAISAFSFASFIVFPNQGLSKVFPPNGSVPGQTKLCQ